MAVRITSHQIGSLRGLTDEQAGERVSAGDPRRQRRDLRAHPGGARQAGHGHHRHGAGADAAALPHRPGGRQPGLPAPQRRVPAAHQGPLLRAGAGGRRAAHAGAGAGPPVQQRDHPLRRRQHGRGARHLLRHAASRATSCCSRPTASPACWRTSSSTRILSADGGPQHWVDRMVTEANRRGGLDNITAIVVRIDSVDSTTGEHPGRRRGAAERSQGPGDKHPLQLDVGPHVARVRLERHPHEPVLLVQPDGRLRAGYWRRSRSPRAPAARENATAAVHQQIAVPASPRRGRHRHLGDLVHLGRVRHHRAGAQRLAARPPRRRSARRARRSCPPDRGRSPGPPPRATNQVSIHSRLSRSNASRHSAGRSRPRSRSPAERAHAVAAPDRLVPGEECRSSRPGRTTSTSYGSCGCRRAPPCPACSPACRAPRARPPPAAPSSRRRRSPAGTWPSTRYRSSSAVWQRADVLRHAHLVLDRRPSPPRRALSGAKPLAREVIHPLGAAAAAGALVDGDRRRPGRRPVPSEPARAPRADRPGRRSAPTKARRVIIGGAPLQQRGLPVQPRR